MSKASEKKERRDKLMSANHDIYKGLVDYLIGPKWTGCKYQIGDLKSKSSAFGIVKVGGEFMGPICSIYFGRDITVYMKCRDHAFCNDFDYKYYECDPEYMNIPTNIDDYILKSKLFLRELLRDVSCKSTINYPHAELDDLSECVNLDKPENFNSSAGIWTILEQEYSYSDSAKIDYVTAIMKSKKYKRFRGDNS